MCRKYESEAGETVFQYLLWSPGVIFGLILIAIGIVIISLVNNRLPSGALAALIVPSIFILIGVLIVVASGGRWVVLSENTDTVYVVEGYLFNLFFRKISPGKLSQLTAVLITVRVSTRTRHNSSGSHSTSTSVSYDTTLHFSNGATKLVVTDSSQSRASDFVVKIKEWLDSHRPNHGIKCGSADQFADGNVIIQTVINPNQSAEQELRPLIVQYQTSSDLNTQAKGQKLNLAMEFNSNSLVGTYAALKQQNPEFTAESEALLLNNAQTIIDVKNGTSQQQLYTQQQYPQQQVYTNQ